ncbi:DUF2332 domain-containing protein [Rhodobaculum claviforme]|uniref:DUF2332 domain-containing protein n=1 Tax=Rhodobaculum claviforme TaxID=1549854 RepID=A0A934THV2_9RHOB|nr:DUF2332 family protein [Rhodobaculum claviforme]MBK5925866.1 hypothetical protein [Rhodobaculum claviforme]
MAASGAFRAQAMACAALDAPFMARALRLIGDRLAAPGALPAALEARLTSWPGDMSARGDAVPLRLAAGLHARVLEGVDGDLARHWPAPAGMSDARLWDGLSRALRRHEAHLLDWLERAPQTNEVARSAVLIAGAHALGGPLVVSELGAAAGLNLLFDHWRLEGPGWTRGPQAAPIVLRPDWTGPPPPDRAPRVVSRAGVDLYPRDPVADRLRLMAYVWADQPARLARLATALRVCARARPPVARANAVDWLAARLADRHPGACHLVIHTIAWQYFPAADRARGEALLAEAGARATPDAPLARLSMEADGRRDGAALTLTQWPGGTPCILGRADFHGRWVRWATAIPPAA